MELNPVKEEDDSYSESQRDSTTDQFRDENDEVPTKPTIGAEENKRVFYSRILVGFVLIICAALTATLAYTVTDREEQNRFESEFVGLASEIIEVSQHAEDNLVKIMHEFGTMVTSSALATGQTWPNVTIPDFERRASASQAVSGGRFLAITLAIPPTDSSRAGWNQYANEHIGWLQESANAANVTPVDVMPFMVSLNPAYQGDDDTENPIAIPSFGDLLHQVLWQVSPPPTTNPLVIKVDFRHLYTERFNYMRDTGRTARSPVVDLNFFLEEPTDDPMNLYYQPLYDTFEENKTLVAFVQMALRWQDHFEDVLYDDQEGIYVVVSNTCNQTVSFEINGREAKYLGEGDLHEKEYEHLGKSAGLTVAMNEILEGSTESKAGISCGYSMTVYPSSKFHDKYATKRPLVYTCIVLGIFAFTTLVFVLYDCLVQKRQETVMDSAVKTNAIVSSLFPEQFRDQLLEQANEEERAKADSKRESFTVNNAKSSLKTFMSGAPDLVDDDELFLTKPVADLFPEATVLFADIVGFTSWASIREPSQVFTLLESIYRSFDKIAKRRQVYKVEVVGDSYVAVAGVPVPMPNHAIVMARFARDCCMRLPLVVHRLEKVLGPGTRDITMRFGLHSGPVTAGVLRGEKARFQLFGDTVNQASRIETTGQGNKIHLSDRTANLLMAAGKSSWIEARPDPVQLKGIGLVKTYWLTASARVGSVADRTENEISTNGEEFKQLSDNARINDQTQRLVEWNVENLSRLLRQIVAGRGTTNPNCARNVTKLMPLVSEGGPSTLDEVAEIIALPHFSHKKVTISPDEVDLGVEVMSQLYSYVSWVAQSYKQNPFHNFEHASHVCMSVSKLLSRIVAPEIDIDINSNDNLHAKLHDHTYGITSDPMTQFAIALSALVHDSDHRGVPNGQLVKEDERLARLYDQSVAEQNSVDICWAKLMSDEYKDLRACIYSSADELKRFRQVIVNTVLATDIFDKQLKELRNARWEKAFRELTRGETLKTKDINRKATIVIEHIIQASDVAHTMQHWHVYTKWNEKLFQEMYLAYTTGRAEKDPSLGWYKGELWFYDFYVIPLAKKLKDCGVFGVSSDEYLNYAQNNRNEWAVKGEGIVQDMVKKYGGVVSETEDVSELKLWGEITNELDV